MEESILTSIKSLLNIENDTNFDKDILIHINSVLIILNQNGVGSEKGFFVKENTTWADYLQDKDDLESVKTYIYLKVKLIFDPPTSSAVIEMYKQLIAEFEWRLKIQSESE